MLGASCSPCCSPCKPDRIPDYLEISVVSDVEDDIYGTLRYRTGRNYTQFGACETEHADAFLLCGIQSGTYTLGRTAVSGTHAWYSWRDEAMSVSVEVDTGLTFQWGGAFPNRFGRGFKISVGPLRIACWNRQWPTYSGLSAVAATEQQIQEARPGIGQVSRTVVDGITNIQYSLADNATQLTGEGLNGLLLFAAALRPCVGGDATISSGDESQRTVVVSETVIPLQMTASWHKSSGIMTDDYAAISQWNPSAALNCGRTFPFPLFISAGGAFTKTYDATDLNYSNAQGVVPFHVVRYDWPITRNLEVTNIVGLMDNGDEVAMT